MLLESHIRTLAYAPRTSVVHAWRTAYAETSGRISDTLTSLKYRALGAGRSWHPTKADPFTSWEGMATFWLDRTDSFPVYDGDHNHALWDDRENLLFRAHHDMVHLAHNLPAFSLMGELRTWRATCNELGAHDRKDPVALVLFHEIVYQAAAHYHAGSFPIDRLTGKQAMLAIDNQFMLAAFNYLWRKGV